MTALASAQSGSARQTLRRLALGDTWQYQVEGSLGGQPIHGTIVVSVEARPKTVLTLVFKQALRVQGETLPMPDGRFMFVQDADTADLSIVGDNMGPRGTDRLATRPQLFYPGHWCEATTYANQLDFNGGGFVRNTLAVIGQAPVATAIGVYPAWVARFTSEGSAMGRLAGTDWWTPELGAPVRFETRSTMPGAGPMHVLATLSAVHFGTA